MKVYYHCLACIKYNIIEQLKYLNSYNRDSFMKAINCPQGPQHKINSSYMFPSSTVCSLDEIKI